MQCASPGEQLNRVPPAALASFKRWLGGIAGGIGAPASEPAYGQLSSQGWGTSRNIQAAPSRAMFFLNIT